MTSWYTHVMMPGSPGLPAVQHQTCSVNIFRFGLFEAERTQGTLTRNGVRVKIQEQPFRVLIFLLEHAGEIVTREELRQRLWPEGTYVDFDGSLNVILKKLRAAIDDDSDNPRFIETIPRRGYRFIAPVSVDEQKAGSEAPSVDLPKITGTSTVREEVPPLQKDSRIFGLGLRLKKGPLLPYMVAALALVIVTGAVWLIHHKAPMAKSLSVPQRKPVQMRKSVAVLGFENVSGRPADAWLATALPEMLSTELAGGDQLRLIPGEDVDNLRLSSPWAQSDTLDQATTSRIGSSLNTDLLVLGSYTVIGNASQGDLRIDVRMQDASTGEIVTEVAEMGSARELFGLVSHIGDKLRAHLGLPGLEEADIAGVLAATPLNSDAVRFYGLGIAKLRQFDPLAAKDILQQAVDADPKFSLGHAMLARAWGQLGYEQKREEESKKAFDLSIDLPRAERMLVEGDYYESLGDHERASSIYRALFELFPDNVEYGLQLAAVDTEAGHGSQALETLDRLRSLPSPSSDDPRIDLAEARIGKNKAQNLALIRKALAKSASKPNKKLYAEARRDECNNLLYGENPGEALASCKEAYDVFLAAGNRMGAADALRITGDYEGTAGHFAAAIATYQRALNILQGLGEHEKTGAILNNEAIIFANEGKLDQAEQLYREARNHFEQAGNKPNMVTALVNIADILYLRGNLQGATRLYEQALQISSLFVPNKPGYLLTRLADLKLAEGRVEEAKGRAEEAIATMQEENGAYQYLTGAMIELGEALEAQGDLPKAREQFEKTLEIRRKVGEPTLAAESQAELAQLAILEDHPEQAEPVLREAIAVFQKQQEDPGASSAYVLLSRALMKEGKLDEARQACDLGTKLSLTSSDPALKLPAAIQNARMLLASSGRSRATASDIAAAQQKLKSAISAARALGYYTLECEARLALGELELNINPAAGRTQLASLAAETRSHGLELVARRAEHAAGERTELAARQTSP